MEHLNSTHPQDGNQVVIAKNSGTIHIHNHSKEGMQMLERLITIQEKQDKQAESFFDFIKTCADKIMKHELRKKK